MTTIVLGGITLSPALQWRERYAYQPVAQSVRRTIGATPVIFHGALVKGEPITLATWSDGGGEYGLLRKSVAVQVIALANVPGAIYTLTFNGVDQSVIFRHDEPPAVDLAPIYPRTADQATEYMRGQIKLLTV